MRFLELELERFGHFEAAHLVLPPSGLCVLHGNNEAGKSTLLAALRCLLFGFPHRTPYDFRFDPSTLAVRASLSLSDGTVAQIRRTKGRKDTVKGEANGQPVDEAWLSAKLRGASQALFENVFGFSLEELADGGRMLAETPVQEALYGAGLGGAVRPDQLIAGLTQEAGALFVRGGQKRLMNAALSRLAELAAQQRSATVGAAQFEALHEAWQRQQQRADELAQSLRRRRLLAARLERVVHVLPRYLELRDAQRELEAMEVPAGFPADGAHQLETLLAERQRLLGEVERCAARLAGAEAARAGISWDARALACEARIDALYRSLERWRKDKEDLPKRQSELVARRLEAQERLAALRPGWTMERLAAVPLDVATRTRVEELAAQHEPLEAAQRQLEREQRALEADRERLSRARAGLEAPPDVERLRLLLREWSGYLAHRDELRQHEAAVQAETARRSALRRALDPPCHASLDPSALPVPRPEQVTEFETKLAEGQARETAALARAGDLKSQLQQAQARLSQLDARRQAPSLRELAELRGERDATWRQLLGGLEPALIVRYETEVLAADGAADRMRTHAQEVQQRIHLEAETGRLAGLFEEAREAVRAARQAREATQAAWEALWARCGFVPLAPAAMRAWLSDRARFVELEAAMGAAETSRGRLVESVAAFEARLRLALGRPDGDPDLLHQELERQVKGADERVARELTLARRQEEAEHQAARLAADRAEAEHARNRWESRWQEALRGLCLDDGLSPVTVRTIVSGLAELQRDVAAQQKLEARIHGIQRDIAAFENELAAVVRDVAPEQVVRDAGETVTGLQRTLEASRTARQLFEERGQQIASAQEMHRELLGQLQAGEAALQALRDRAGVADDDAVREVAQRAGLAARLSAAVAEGRRVIRQAAEEMQTAEADFLALLEATRLDAARAELQEHARAIELLEAELHGVQQEAGAARSALERVDGSGRAAELQMAIESERAGLRDLAWRYAVLTIGRTLLESEVRRFEREHQPELLARSGVLLSRMTRGRWVAVRRRLDGGLVVVSHDGVERAPDALSTGTAQQLYLAIRLAYVDQYRKAAEPLPLVLDDILVNFDDVRASGTLEALHEVSRDVQVLLFTCHPHLVALTRDVLPEVPILQLPSATRAVA
ncbi:MAG: AAA family ATPase [Candidatus Xenobia bacterium]